MTNSDVVRLFTVIFIYVFAVLLLLYRRLAPHRRGAASGDESANDRNAAASGAGSRNTTAGGAGSRNAATTGANSKAAAAGGANAGAVSTGGAGSRNAATAGTSVRAAAVGGANTRAKTNAALSANMRSNKKKPQAPAVSVPANVPQSLRNIWNRRFYILVAAALLLRLAFSYQIEGFPSDMACFKAWSQAASDDFLAIYNNSGGWFIDYPPGYMYVLLFLGQIQKLFNIPTFGRLYTTLIKLPSILSDVACGVVIYKLTGKTHLSKAFQANKNDANPDAEAYAAKTAAKTRAFPESVRLLIAAFYFFNPVVFFISTIWGQVDSVLTLLLFLAIITFLNEHWYASGALYVLAVLQKPQGIILLPVAFFMLLIRFISDRDIRPVLKMIASAAATALVLILPFAVRLGPLWIVNLYLNTVAGYKLAAMNAFNFFALIGGNWVGDSETPFLFTFAAWGMIAIVFYTLLTGFFIFYARRVKNASAGYTMFMGSALLLFSVVTFGHRMHERYFFPALLFLLAASIYGAKQGPVLANYAWVTASGFFNCLVVFAAFYTHTDSDFYGDNRIYIISALNVGAALVMWATAFLGLKPGGGLRNAGGADGVMIFGSFTKFFKQKILTRRTARLSSIVLLSVLIFMSAAGPVAAYALEAPAAVSDVRNDEAAGVPVALKNPGFEESAGDDARLDGVPGWYLYDYREQQANEPGTSYLSFEAEYFHSGSSSIRIESYSVNDVRLYQSIPVDPNSTYRASCWAKTDSVGNEGVGANLSVIGLFTMSNEVKGTNGDFERLVLYGKTGPTQKELQLAVGLGGYSNESYGTAWFDDVSLEKLEIVPQDAEVQMLYSEYSRGDDGEKGSQPNYMPVGARVLLFLTVIIILAVLALIAMKVTRPDKRDDPPRDGGTKINVSKTDASVNSTPRDGVTKIKVSKTDTSANSTPRDGGAKIKASKTDASANSTPRDVSQQKNGAGPIVTDGDKVRRFKPDRNDALIMTILTVVYLALALYRLGGDKAPQTWWKSGIRTYSVVFRFEKPSHLKKILYNCNAVQHEESESMYEVYAIPAENTIEPDPTDFSDGESYICAIDDKAFYEWKSIAVDAKDLTGVRLVAKKPGMALNEIAFFGTDENASTDVEKYASMDAEKYASMDAEQIASTDVEQYASMDAEQYEPYAAGSDGADRLLPVTIDLSACSLSKYDTGDVGNLIDEQDTAPARPDILNGTYFDEIYFARTAYEHIHSMQIYETTHPPLGKLIIALGILIFGMNPFGWRIMGTLAGAAMIPVAYIFGRKLFDKKIYAFCAAFLLTFDFMHFSQTRLTSIDSYATLLIMLMYMFIFDSFMNGIDGRPLREALVPLGLTGLTFGLGVSVKWIALYAGAGLAFIFALSRVKEIRDVFGFADARRKRSRNRGQLARQREINYMSRLGTVAAACILFFILIPGIIYLLSYIPYTKAPGAEHGLFKTMLDNQKSMYDYHSRLTDTHPFESIWWKWPLDIRPIWYYSASGLPGGQKANVASFGNPLIWWTGIPCIIAAFILAYRKNDRKMVVVFTAFLFQFAPWIFIARATFIYHYFSSTPFLIFAIVYVVRELIESKTVSAPALYVYLAAVAALFAAYYPILSGLPISAGYSEKLRLFSSWLW